MERKWRAMGFLLFGMILSSAPAQDRSLPTALLVSFPDAPTPWKTCSGPRTLKVTAVYSSGQPVPYNGVGRAQSPSDSKCNVNGMEIPIVNGVGALPNSVVWYKPGENIVQVSTKDGALKGEAKATIVPQEKDIKLEIEKPEPKPGYVWAGSVFKVRIKATANGKPVEDVILKALDSKGVIVSPQTLVTDLNGFVECELFTPNFLCPTASNGNGTLEDDARLSAKFFLDVDGDDAIDDGEPGDGFDEIPITEPCPQELIPCALELCRILAAGGVIVAGPALGPTPASIATEVTRKPDQEKAERAILRDACRFLEDQVIGFITSGKWSGKFSDIVKRLEHVIKFLRPVERARPVVQRLECAIERIGSSPDLFDSKLDLVDINGRIIVHVNFRDFIRVQLLGKRRRILNRGAFTDCLKPAIIGVKTKGPGSARPITGVEAEQPAFEFSCDGVGKVELETDLAFQPEQAIIIDGGGIDATRVLRGSVDVIGETLAFVLKDECELLQEPPDIDVDTNRNGAVEEGAADDEGEDAVVVYLGNRGALVFANVDDDDKDADQDNRNKVIDGGGDLLDVVAVVIRRIPNLAQGARVVLTIDNTDAVRIFDRRAVGATEVIGPGGFGLFEIPRAMITQQDVILGLEGLRFNQQVKLNVSISLAGRIPSFDEARVLVTPWLMASNVDPASEVYVSRWPARANPADRDNRLFLADIRSKIVRGIQLNKVTFLAGLLAEFIQDPVEVGYQRIRGSVPAAVRTMPVALDLPYAAGASPSHDKFAEGVFMGPDRGAVVVEPNVDPGGRGAAYGGNLELIPPFKSHSLGIAVVGDNMGDSPAFFIELNREQTPNPAAAQIVRLPFNSASTNIDHVDEVINVIPSRSQDGFAIVIGDPRRAIAHIPPAGSPLGDRLVPYRVRTDDVDRSEKTLNDIQAALESLGLPASSFVRIPVFYPLPSDPVLFNFFGLPNGVNLQVVNGAVFVPEPAMDDPTDPTHTRIFILTSMKNDITRRLASAGIAPSQIQFVDTRELSAFGGEVHCATNALRAPR